MRGLDDEVAAEDLGSISSQSRAVMAQVIISFHVRHSTIGFDFRFFLRRANRAVAARSSQGGAPLERLLT
jgi:hypothetical protein